MKSGIQGARFSPDSNILVTIGAGKDEFKVWRKQQGGNQMKWAFAGMKETMSQDDPFRQVRFSPDGSLFCLATKNVCSSSSSSSSDVDA